jgi:hypothetical protein
MESGGKIRSPWFYVALSIVPGLGLIALGKWKELGRSILYIIFMIGIVLLSNGGDFEFFPILIYFGIQILLVYPWQVATASFLIEQGDLKEIINSNSKKLFLYDFQNLERAQRIVSGQAKESEEIHFAIVGTKSIFWTSYVGLSSDDLIQIEMDFFNVNAFRVIRDPVASIQKVELKKGIISDGLSLTLDNGVNRKYRISRFSKLPYVSMVMKIESMIHDSRINE